MLSNIPEPTDILVAAAHLVGGCSCYEYHEKCLSREPKELKRKDVVIYLTQGSDLVLPEVAIRNQAGTFTTATDSSAPATVSAIADRLPASSFEGSNFDDVHAFDMAGEKVRSGV